MSAFNCMNARPGEPGTRCAHWCGNKETCICVETGEAGLTLDKIAFSRWMAKQSNPTLEAAFCAGRADGYTLARMVNEMTTQDQVPDGYALVPNKPTDAMMDAWNTTGPYFEDAYAEMIATAPQPPADSLRWVTEGKDWLADALANKDLAGPASDFRPEEEVIQTRVLRALKKYHERNSAPPTSGRCEHCDGTGDVHRADGEWLGSCKCQATPAQAGAELPELPELPEPWQCETRMCPQLFTADQMLAYAELARRRW